ncbi:MAG: hypothetical protein ACREQ4_02955 [Candidatus Binataceae bacterium]
MPQPSAGKIEQVVDHAAQAARAIQDAGDRAKLLFAQTLPRQTIPPARALMMASA